MAVLGKKPVRTVGNYQNHPMYALANEFSNVAKSMLQEEQINIFIWRNHNGTDTTTRHNCHA